MCERLKSRLKRSGLTNVHLSTGSLRKPTEQLPGSDKADAPTEFEPHRTVRSAIPSRTCHRRFHNDQRERDANSKAFLRSLTGHANCDHRERTATGGRHPVEGPHRFIRERAEIFTSSVVADFRDVHEDIQRSEHVG